MCAQTYWLNGKALSEKLEIQRPSLYYTALVFGQCLFLMTISYVNRSFSWLDERNINVSSNPLFLFSLLPPPLPFIYHTQPTRKASPSSPFFLPSSSENTTTPSSWRTSPAARSATRPTSSSGTSRASIRCRRTAASSPEPAPASASPASSASLFYPSSPSLRFSASAFGLLTEPYLGR